MNKNNPIRQAQQYITKSPILWGITGAVGFYALIEAGPLDLPLVRRYFAGHPVEYMETVIFAVGLAVLVIKGFDLLGQWVRLARPALAAVATTARTQDAAAEMLARLDRLPSAHQDDSYLRRLRAALEHVRARDSAQGLDDELKFLADAEAARVHNSYGLFRVIVWAIPILGFLGTVIGITVALNSVDLNAPDQSMVQVLTGLGLKFDTTALALSLSMALMFLHFFVDRAEAALLERVDRRAARELVALFPALPAGPDGHLLAVRRMAETVVQAAELLVQRQAELWQASMESAATRWTQLAETAGGRLQTALTAALGESLANHARQLAAAEQAVVERHQATAGQLQQGQAQAAENLAALEAAVQRQVEMLERAVAASGEVVGLEESLNSNLAALANANHLEETLVSLAAAVNLLSARLAEMPTAKKTVQLAGGRKASRAA